MTLYRRILVALDGSEASRRALRVALELARALGANLHAIGVEEHLPHYAATLGEVQEAKAEANAFFEEVMAGARALAAEYGVPLTTEVRAGNAAQQIINLARQGGFDLIVLGAHGHSFLEHFLLGSTTDRVVDHAPCSVLVVR
jgi:nucleotide-binding universal stress UspA family protein